MDVVETAVSEIEAQGYTIVRDLVTEARLRALQDDAEALLHTISMKGIDGGQVEARMHKGTFGVSRAFDDIIIHPVLLAIVKAVLSGPREPAYPNETAMAQHIADLPNQDHGIKCNIMIKDNVPREDIRALHRDVSLAVPRPHRAVICNSLLALDPFTEDTGATCVIPGSHKWNDPIPGDAETIPVLMDPGSIVIFDGELWHGHGPNVTRDRYRRCLNLNYHYRWLDNFHNPRLPEETWARLPDALRAVA